MEKMKARKLPRKQPPRKKKGGMVNISKNVKLIGFGDEGCFIYDNGEYYKMITPKYLDNEEQEPSEVAFVKNVKHLNLDTETFVYPHEYHKVPIQQLQNAVKACPTLHSTIRNFNIQDVYIGNIKFAGTPLEYLIGDKHFRKLNNDEVVNVMTQLEYIINYLKVNKIVHHDIHPGNITFTGLDSITAGNRNIKVHLIDFGLAEYLNETTSSKGSPHPSSPSSPSSPNKGSPHQSSPSSPNKGSPHQSSPNSPNKGNSPQAQTKETLITDEIHMVKNVLPALRMLIESSSIRQAIPHGKTQKMYSSILHDVVNIKEGNSNLASTSSESQRRKRKLKYSDDSSLIPQFNIPQATNALHQDPEQEQDPFSPQRPQRDLESIKNLTSMFNSKSLSKGGSKPKKPSKK